MGDEHEVGVELEEDEKALEHEEKARLITQVLELQSTLEELSSRVDGVKEENLRLRSENQVLGQYIENLMTASKVFQGTEERPSKLRLLCCKRPLCQTNLSIKSILD